MRLYYDSNVQYSYVDDITRHDGSHNAGVSLRGGSATLTRNYIQGSSSSALSLYSDSAITDFTATENLFVGGSYSVNFPESKAEFDACRNIDFLDNRFTDGSRYGDQRSYYGPKSSVCPEGGSEWTGNAYLGGTAIP